MNKLTNAFMLLPNLSKRQFSKQIISFTPKAINKIRQMYTEKRQSDNSTQSMMMKISVKNQGCSGNSYSFNWIPILNSDIGRSKDEIVCVSEEEESEALKVVVEAKSIFKLIGSEVDWEESELSSGFVFKNPNAVTSCGCGESFAIENEKKQA